MKRLRISRRNVILAASGLCLVGCANVSAIGSTNTAVQSSALNSVYAGSLSSNGLGWVFQRGILLTTPDQGSSWVPVPVPSGVTQDTFADFHILQDRSVILASVADGVGVLWTSSNMGLSWSQAPTQLGSDVADIHFVASDDGTILGAAVEQMSSAAVSHGSFLKKTTAGWESVETPVAGHISAGAGSLWLVGGTLRNQIYVSHDAGSHWATASTPALGATERAFGVLMVGGELVIPVTKTEESGGTYEDLLSSTDGTSWNASKPIRLPGSFVNTAAPAGILNGQVFVPGSTGETAVSFSPDGQTAATVSMPGLPSGVLSISQGSTVSWAVYSATNCVTKTLCTTSAGLAMSSDMGKTWASPPVGTTTP